MTKKNKILLSCVFSTLVFGVCLFLILISLTYKSVPVNYQHMFEDLHSFLIFEHSMCLATFIIMELALNFIIWFEPKENDNNEQCNKE